MGAVTITLLYFAALREIVGHGEATFPVPEGIVTVGDLADHLDRTVAGLGGRLGSVRWAKNEEFVDRTTALEDGDVVALIPPVAGGSR